MSSDQGMRAVVERIERLAGEFAAAPDPAVRRNARELVQLVMRLYGAGLSRMLRIAELHDGAGKPAVGALLEDDLVASLLVLHDLHPDDVETRIRRGLARLEAPAGVTITLLEARDGAAHVRVDDDRGAAGMLDLQRLIDDVVRAVAPDIARVTVEGLPPRPSAPLVQLARRPSPGRPAEAHTP